MVGPWRCWTQWFTHHSGSWMSPLLAARAQLEGEESGGVPLGLHLVLVLFPWLCFWAALTLCPTTGFYCAVSALEPAGRGLQLGARWIPSSFKPCILYQQREGWHAQVGEAVLNSHKHTVLQSWGLGRGPLQELDHQSALSFSLFLNLREGLVKLPKQDLNLCLPEGWCFRRGPPPRFHFIFFVGAFAMAFHTPLVCSNGCQKVLQKIHSEFITQVKICVCVSWQRQKKMQIRERFRVYF